MVRALNADAAIDGILVQLPLPDAAIEREIIEAIDPAKDVDGFHPTNIGRMVQGLPAFVPCTPNGVLEMLRRAGIPLSGAAVTIIGRSQLVGRPLSILMSQKGVDATVTLCHTRTKDLARFTRDADVVATDGHDTDTLCRALATLLHDRFDITHATLQMERAPCDEPGCEALGAVCDTFGCDSAGAVFTVGVAAWGCCSDALGSTIDGSDSATSVTEPVRSGSCSDDTGPGCPPREPSSWRASRSSSSSTCSIE